MYERLMERQTSYATSIGISTYFDIVNGLTLNHPLFLALYPGVFEG